MMKKTPGPLAPPDSSLPSLKMTALSYSCTTLTTNISDRGRVIKIRRTEIIVRRWAHSPGPSEQSKALFCFCDETSSFIWHLSEYLGESCVFNSKFSKRFLRIVIGVSFYTKIRFQKLLNANTVYLIFLLPGQ